VSDRYWLDRIIKDDLPVQDEPTLEPTVSSLFVQPMDARALRPDAAHRQVPRPHFPDRRPQSGIGQPDTPQPDIPVPDANRPDSEDDTHPGRIRPQQPAAPTRNPGVPLAPAAESMTAVVEPVEVSAASVTAPRQKQRIVRTDSSHRSEAPMEHSADRPPGPAGRGPVRPADAHSSKHSEITVRPARSVVEGADLLDRVLASVNSSQNDERTAQKEQKGQS